MTTAITLLSAAVVLAPNVNLFGIMMLAQVINGVLQAQGCKRAGCWLGWQSAEA